MQLVIHINIDVFACRRARVHTHTCTYIHTYTHTYAYIIKGDSKRVDKERTSPELKMEMNSFSTSPSESNHDQTQPTDLQADP